MIKRPQIQRRRIAALVAALTMTFGTAAPAQPGARPNPICWRPRSLEAGCSGFVDMYGVLAGSITASHHPIASFREVVDLPGYGGAGLGYFRNFGNNALGVTGEVAYGEAGRAAALLHYRRWLPWGTSADLAAGPLFADIFIEENGGDARRRARGGTIALALTERHGLGVFVDANRVTGEGRSSSGVHIGARCESLVGAVALGGVALAWSLLYFSSE